MNKRLYNRVNREELIEKMKNDSTPRTTISFYKYAHIKNPVFFRDHLYLLLEEVGTLGRIYVSKEGINAQISIPTARLESFKDALATVDFMGKVRLNFAIEDIKNAFFKLLIKVRDKIVADGLDDLSFDVTNIGTHLKASEFNAITDDPDTILVDMRNHYESEVGKFKGAITPDVETFREELPIVELMLENQKDKNLVLYCTGGIRCEKASAYFKHRGFEKVYQLEGGIIEYARQVKNQNLENKFVGKNFVFDERLGERITEDVIAKCHQCGTNCDNHTNCANEACHILFIQCNTCSIKLNGCCSSKCSDYLELPEYEKKNQAGSIEFNGTKFGKGRYKANHSGNIL